MTPTLSPTTGGHPVGLCAMRSCRRPATQELQDVEGLVARYCDEHAPGALEARLIFDELERSTLRSAGSHDAESAPAPQEGQSWGEVADEQAAAEEAAEGRSCHSCGGAVAYIGAQSGERWYRCSSCEVEQTEAELAAPQQWRTEFVTVRGDTWASNALVFDTPEAAEQECRDRAFRWTAVKLGRVVPTSTPTRQPCDYDAPGPVVVDYR